MNHPDQLFAQLVGRTHSFKNPTGLSSRDLCQLTDINEQHLCDFMAGRKGLSLTSTVRLLELFSLSRTQLEAKLRPPKKILIEHFQSLDGKPLTLDDSGGSWVPGQSGQDPNDSGTDDEQALLEEISGLHQQIVDKIKAYQDTYPHNL
jgi:hypothetical protein